MDSGCIPDVNALYMYSGKDLSYASQLTFIRMSNFMNGRCCESANGNISEPSQAPASFPQSERVWRPTSPVQPVLRRPPGLPQLEENKRPRELPPIERFVPYFFNRHLSEIPRSAWTGEAVICPVYCAANAHRNQAKKAEPTHTFTGQLPRMKFYRKPTYSRRVFVGGIPWNITESTMQRTFNKFGPMSVEFPRTREDPQRYPEKCNKQKAGHAFLLFDRDESVQALLRKCKPGIDRSDEYYYDVANPRCFATRVQVIPWALNDNKYVLTPSPPVDSNNAELTPRSLDNNVAEKSSQPLDHQKTVFVASLHGMLSAERLAHVFANLFGEVLCSGIDTDEDDYHSEPGRDSFRAHRSGWVTFKYDYGHIMAMDAESIEVKTEKFTKKIQITPYLDESPCSTCGHDELGSQYFCRDFTCFDYYCGPCWQTRHDTSESTRSHKPLLMRNDRTLTDEFGDDDVMTGTTHYSP